MTMSAVVRSASGGFLRRKNFLLRHQLANIGIERGAGEDDRPIRTGRIIRGGGGGGGE